MTIRSLIISMIGLAGCMNASTSVPDEGIKENDLGQASWLLGTWFNDTGCSVSYEVWTQHNDSTYLGTSFTMQALDTVSTEFIRLVEREGEISYIPILPDQNKGMPVPFKMVYMDSSKVIFENLEHDFPQTITYEYLSPDSLVAEISGTIKGEYRAQKFPMRRMH